ncbi:MAG TPA: DUF3189 family protein [Syntrophomonas sp.]|nr:DUF3189 family protein [Syntrophomonas sp.]
MNLIFLGSTGVHQALLAASMHLDPQLKQLRPDCRDLPHFNDYWQEAGGRPLYVGTDQAGRRIHTLGVGPDVTMARKTIEHLRIILDTSAEELQLIPIVIRSQRLIDWLHKPARLNWLKPLSSYLIAGLLKWEYHNVKGQILTWTNHH